MSPRVVHEHHEFRNRVYDLLPWLVSGVFALLVILGILVYFVWFSPSTQGGHPSTASQGAGPQHQAKTTTAAPKSNVNVTQAPSTKPQPAQTAAPQAQQPSAPTQTSGQGPAQPGGTAQGRPGAAPPPPPPPSQARHAAAKISMTSDNAFDPQTVTVPAGGVIVWKNTGDKAHTVTMDGSTGPNSDTKYPNGIPAGQTYVWKVPADAASGTTYYYHCRFHGQPGDGTTLGQGMAGSITVK